jgi:hypothetical protein
MVSLQMLKHLKQKTYFCTQTLTDEGTMKLLFLIILSLSLLTFSFSQEKNKKLKYPYLASKKRIDHIKSTYKLIKVGDP